MAALDTIFALSSGMSPAAIAIIRISGPSAFDAAITLGGPLPPERHAALRSLRHPVSQDVLDQAIVLRFGAGRSVTGEDLVELHCHGGRAVIQAVLSCLAEQGLRPAEAGEFTRRALMSGRMDLNEVEGLSDLLRAETESQRKAALAMYGGAFSAKVKMYRDRLLRISAQVEAVLDFSDDDVPNDDGPIRMAIADVVTKLDRDLDQPPVERLRDGIRLVIAGPVNSGKSTLLNHLAQRDAAIVTAIPGTTRDLIEVAVSIGGTPFLLTDTAGFRDVSADEVEGIGMDRAREAMIGADILLWLGSATQKPREDAILILSRIDREDVCRSTPHDVALSVFSGEGLDRLGELISHRAEALLGSNEPYLLSQRQRTSLEEVRSCLTAASTHRDMVLVGENVRYALEGLDRLCGSASVDDMLDTLFASFCIGK